MKQLFFISTLVFSLDLFSQDIPSTPPNACYEGCTPKMEKLLQEFETIGVLPSQEPAVYSGVCNHNGQYNPDHDHHAVVLLDQIKGQWMFRAILSFFSETNEYANWDLEKARSEMNDYWGDAGKITSADKTARVIYNYPDGSWAYIYWMRQNPQTEELYFIYYSGTVMRSFCRLSKNP